MVRGTKIPTLAEGIPVMYVCLLLFIYRLLFVFIGSLELEPCTLPTAQHSCCNCGDRLRMQFRLIGLALFRLRLIRSELAARPLVRVVVTELK